MLTLSLRRRGWESLGGGVPGRVGRNRAPGGAGYFMLMLKPWGPIFNCTPCCTA
jgi:hypothetical protein